MTDDPQQTLFDWAELLRLEAPARPARGAVSVSGLPTDCLLDPAAIHELHRQLELALGTVDLVVTDNRRRMVTARRRRERQEIRLHHMFVDADDATVQAVAGLARGEKGAREIIRAYIQQNRDAIRNEPDPEQLTCDGVHHQLDVMLDRVRALLSDVDLEPIRITWGRDGRGRRSIRFGSFDFEQRLIRIHPALDQAWVPDYFVEFVVYHEALHAMFPPKRSGSRRVLHPPEFRAWEEKFPRYEDAMRWERDNLRRLLDRDVD